MSGSGAKRWACGSVLLAAALLAGTPAAARERYEVPPGPYRAECRQERVEGGYMLQAMCPMRSGQMRPVALDLRTCPRGAVVYNDNARLRCDSGGGYNPGYGYSVPPGPYRQECRQERVEGGHVLHAVCPTRRGEMRPVALDLRACPAGSPVYNDNARLHCGAGPGVGTGGGGWFGPGTGTGVGVGVAYGLPPGPYRHQCRGERILNGYLLVATCPKANGDMRDASLDLRTCPRGAAVYNEGAYLRCR